jgi:tetratricopeptide (TPR) repeat protein
MPNSAFNRFWNTVKPPSTAKRPAASPQVVALRRRQRRLVTITVVTLVVVGAGAGVFAYVTNAPQRADKEFQEGMKMMGPTKYPGAIVHFTNALAICGQLPEAYLERGNAHRALGDMDEALADFRAAADLNPVLAEAHNGMAMIYVDRRDSTHALEELNKSLALKPNVEALYQRAQILEAQGDHKRAIGDYDAAIAEDPNAPHMYRARALAKANLGDNDGAHADRQIAQKIEHH